MMPDREGVRAAKGGPSEAKLTNKQRAVLDMLLKWERQNDGTVNEGNVMDDLWPLVRQARHVANALQRKGLIRFGDWYDDAGYDLHLTDAGREFGTTTHAE